MPKHIWEWIKDMAHKIADLIPGRFKHRVQENPDPAPGVLTELDKTLGQKIQHRQEKMGRPVNTSRGGPNMPRYQFCDCGRPSKRTGKTMGGAYYKCSKHGEFFIRAPRL